VNRLPLCLALLALVFAGVPAFGEKTSVADEGSATLAYRTHRDFKLILPKETFRPVGAKIDLSSCLSKSFATKLEGTALLLDSNGDGTLDVRAEGESALVTFRGKNAAGDPATYSVRLVNRSGWKYAASGVVAGTVGSTKVRILDANGNGSYADYGVDAMFVGRGHHAQHLSKAMHVGGKLYSIDVAKDGAKVTWRPFSGKTGTLDLSDCETKAKVLSVVVTSVDGDYSFDMAKHDGPTVVPAGRYELTAGELGLGDNRLKLRAGRAKAIEVGGEAPQVVAWGGPVTAAFRYRRVGAEVRMAPEDVWYHGRAGEEYHSWFPTGQSPTFRISNRKNGREIATAFFPGST